MFIRQIALSGVLAFHALPAMAENIAAQHKPKPRAITSVAIANYDIEMLAVTRRARADTPLRREFLHESKAMSKVMPGYPQQPVVSVDLRIKF